MAQNLNSNCFAESMLVLIFIPLSNFNESIILVYENLLKSKVHVRVSISILKHMVVSTVSKFCQNVRVPPPPFLRVCSGQITRTST